MGLSPAFGGKLARLSAVSEFIFIMLLFGEIVKVFMGQIVFYCKSPVGQGAGSFFGSKSSPCLGVVSV